METNRNQSKSIETKRNQWKPKETIGIETVQSQRESAKGDWRLIKLSIKQKRDVYQVLQFGTPLESLESLE